MVSGIITSPQLGTVSAPVAMLLAVSALLALAAAVLPLPDWEELNCQPGHRYLFSDQVSSDWRRPGHVTAGSALIGPEPAMGAGGGRVRAVRGLPGQARQPAGAELPHDARQRRQHQRMVLDQRWLELC